MDFAGISSRRSAATAAEAVGTCLFLRAAKGRSYLPSPVPAKETCGHAHAARVLARGVGHAQDLLPEVLSARVRYINLRGRAFVIARCTARDAGDVTQRRRLGSEVAQVYLPDAQKQCLLGKRNRIQASRNARSQRKNQQETYPSTKG